jgi:TatD DNase family protein
VSTSVLDGWFDTHCHVHDERMPGGAAAAIDEARSAGVSEMITVGCDRATSLAALDIAAHHDHVYATVGLHPHEARFGVDSIADLFAHDPTRDTKAVAVGECGLDYYYDHSPRDVQRDAFAAQIGLAKQLDLPLVIHTRDAWADTFDILDAAGMPDRAVFHCFTGGADEARQCLDRGAYLSFSGIVTFKSATDVQAAATLCPTDRMLIETDSPYLAPAPNRGKVNRPAWVPLVGTYLANLRGVPIDELRFSTAATARFAFGVTPS